MRYLSSTELSGVLDTAIHQLTQSRTLVLQGEQEAMRLAALGVDSVEANAAGIEAYRRAGQLAFTAMQTVMYTQNDSAQPADLKDSAVGCATMFADIATNGFLYPIFAKTGCPKNFRSFAPAAYNNNADAVDAGLPTSNADRLMLIAHAHEEYAIRKMITGGSGRTNPFRALQLHFHGSSAVLHISQCDAVGDANTATPVGIEGGNFIGVWISADNTDYAFDVAATTINIDGSFGAPGSPAAGYEAWLIDEHFIALNIDVNLGTTPYAVQLVAAGDATDVVVGTNLLVRVIADSYLDISGELSGYDPST